MHPLKREHEVFYELRIKRLSYKSTVFFVLDVQIASFGADTESKAIGKRQFFVLVIEIKFKHGFLLR